MSTNLKIIKDINSIIENPERLDPNYITFVKISLIIKTLESLIQCGEDELYSYLETPAYKQLIKEVKELYGFECSSTFSIIDNYVIIHSGDIFIVDGHRFKINDNSFMGFEDLRNHLSLNNSSYIKLTDSFWVYKK